MKKIGWMGMLLAASTLLNAAHYEWSFTPALPTNESAAELATAFYAQNGKAVVLWRDSWEGIKSSVLLAGSTAWTPPYSLASQDENAYSSVGFDNSGRALALVGTGNFTAFQMGPNDTIWGVPQLLGSGKTPFMVFNPSGLGAAAWASDDQRIVVTTISLSSSPDWSAPVVLSPPGEAANQPVVAADQDGNVVCVWVVNLDSERFILKSSTLLAGQNSWSEPIIVSEDVDQNGVPELSLSMNLERKAAVCWTGTCNAIKVAQLPDLTGPWSTASTVSCCGTSPSAQILRRGDILVVWSDKQGPHAQSRFFNTDNASWGAIIPVKWLGGTSLKFQMTPKGLGFAVGVSRKSAGYIVQAVSFDMRNGITWGAPVNLATLSAPAPIDISLDEVGNLFVVWKNSETEIKGVCGMYTLPLPPTDFAGVRLNPGTSRASVRLTWQLSTTPNLKGYHVYRNGMPIATLSNSKTTYTDKTPGAGPTTYSIASFDLNDESSAVYIEVP